MLIKKERSQTRLGFHTDILYSLIFMDIKNFFEKHLDNYLGVLIFLNILHQVIASMEFMEDMERLTLYGEVFFDEVDPEHWGNIGVAMLTLVQVATYDDWGAIMWELIVVYPIAWIYFVSFIIVNAVVLLNMVIGVIVDVMTKESRDGFMPDADK